MDVLHSSSSWNVTASFVLPGGNIWGEQKSGRKRIEKKGNVIRIVLSIPFGKWSTCMSAGLSNLTLPAPDINIYSIWGVQSPW